MDLLKADARTMEVTLMRDLIAPIVRLNLGEDAPLPSLKLLVEDPEDLSLLANYVVKLTQAGLPIPQWWVRERFGIPEAMEDEAVLGGSSPEKPDRSQETAALARAVPALHATRPCCDAHAREDQDLAAQAPDLLADRLEIEAEPAWGEIMDRIRAIVDAADSLPALRDALLAAFGDLPTDRLAEVMAIGFAAAELAGRFAVEMESGDGR
jgi:phage gp29-like protein